LPGTNTLAYYNNSSLFVEERIESYIYDLGNFLAAAGGHLGLSLGFSCLSALLTFVRYLRGRLTATESRT